jgi:hypothetical protein
MSALLNLDPSAELNVAGIWTGHSFSWELDFFEDDNVTPLNVPGTVTMSIYEGVAANGSPVMTLTAGSGLTISGNTITIARSKSQNTLHATQYYYTICDDIDGDTSFQSVYGNLKVGKSR